MKKRITMITSVILAAAMLFSMAGCASQPAATTAQTTQAAVQQTKAAETQPAVTAPAPETAPAEAKFKKDIIIGTNKKYTNSDPQSISNGSHRMLFHLTHDALFYINPATSELENAVAEGYELSDDMLTYTFKLKKGIKFHNGEPLTADDVIFTFQRGAETSAGALRGTFKQVVDYKAVDDLTVQMTLSSPNVDFVSNIAVPGFGILNRKAVEADPEHGADIGCGPWMHKEFVDNDYVLLARFDDYYDEVAKAETLKIQTIPESSAQLVALQNGEIDLCMDPNNSELQIIADDPNLNLIQFNSMAETYLAINMLQGPLGDSKELRQAIRYALNLDEIIIGAYDGYAIKAASTYGWAQKYYDDSFEPYPTDLEKAKALMAEAGYPNGFDVEIITNNKQRVTASTIIQAQLKQIGINLKVSELDSAGITARQESDDFQITMYDNNWFAYADDVRRLYSAESSNNNANYVNERIQELISLGASETDDAKREAIYKEIQEIAYDDCAYIPICYATKAIATVKGLGGVDYDPGTSHDFSHVYVIEE